MADVLVAGGALEAGSLSEFLGDMLSEQHIVVADPEVAGRPLDAIIVGPACLIALQVKDWPVTQQIAAGAADAARIQALRRDLAHSADAALAVLRLFMRDEFPTLQISAYHLHVVFDPRSDVTSWRVLAVDGTADENLLDAIASKNPPAGDATLTEDDRQAVAGALRDHRLIASQRANAPFVFHTARGLGGGSRVWTIRAAVQYMEQHPQDGIHHLRNGTFSSWLDAQQAGHLAKLARDAVTEARSDGDMALELFLARTGLVKRPRVKIIPPKLDLGYIAEGDAHSASFQIKQRRGYLFGAMHTSDPWVRVETSTFQGQPVKAQATVSTRTLLIRSEPYRAEIRIDAGPGNGNTILPVHFHVVAAPSAFSRFCLRPGAFLLAAGGLGAAIGLLWETLGMPAAGSARFGYPWIIGFACLWALSGAAWRLFAPRLWPAWHALRRLAAQIALWWIAGSAIMLAGLAYWRAEAGDAAASVWSLLAAAGLLAGAGAIVPAALTMALAARRHRQRDQQAGQTRLRRWPLIAVSVILLIVLLFLSVSLLGPDGRSVTAQEVLRNVSAWVDRSWEQLNGAVGQLLDQFYLDYYDRRAP